MSLPRFLFGAARSGTNALAHSLGKSSDITVYNEDNAACFDTCILLDNDILVECLKTSLTNITFFKSFNDTSRALALLDQFPTARAIYAIRRPADSIASFIREFGKTGAEFWPQLWLAAIAGGTGDIGRITRDCYPAQAVVLKNATKCIKLLDRFGSTAQNVAACYYIFQHSYYLELQYAATGRFLVVDYDNLVRNPALVMDQVFDWFGAKRANIDPAWWHRGRGPADASGVSRYLLESCSLIYKEINSKSQIEASAIHSIAAQQA